MLNKIIKQLEAKIAEYDVLTDVIKNGSYEKERFGLKQAISIIKNHESEFEQEVKVITEVRLIFVYHNEEKKKIKVLTHTQAREKNDELISNGWKHTATLDPCRWVEYLFNESEGVDIIAEIRELSLATKRSKPILH